MLGKRVLDLVISTIGLVICAPLFALVAVAIKLDSPGPVFFRQERIGKDGRPFYPYKFRTMVVNAERIGLGLNVAGLYLPSAADVTLLVLLRRPRSFFLLVLQEVVRHWSRYGSGTPFMG